MIRNVVDKAWYSDCDLSRNQFSLFNNGHILFNNIRINLPIFVGLTENVLFLNGLVLGNLLYLTGQGGRSGNCWLYTSSQWKDLGPTFGTNCCVFANNKLYVVISGNQYKIFDLSGKFLSVKKRQIGVNGIRIVYSNDEIVTGDETYDGSMLPFHLAEYTPLGDLTIGQGYNGGCIAVKGNDRRILESGDCRFIRAYRDNDNNIAVAIVKQLEDKAVFLYFNINELKDLPVDIIVPDNPLPDEPFPLPEKPKMKLPNEVKVTRDKFIAKFPFPVGSGAIGASDEYEEKFRQWFGKLVQQIVFSHPNKGWGWKKAGGPPSKDSIANNSGNVLVAYDLFLGVGTGNPVLNNDPDSIDITGQTFIPVEGVDRLGSIVDDPQPIPNPNPKPNELPVKTVDELIHNVLPRYLAAYKAKHDGNDPSYENLTFQIGRMFIEGFSVEEMLSKV